VLDFIDKMETKEKEAKDINKTHEKQYKVDRFIDNMDVLKRGI
jgi:hypothetical protein